MKQTFGTLICLSILFSISAQEKTKIIFSVSIKDPASHYFQVQMECSGFGKNVLEFKMPAWTPGYYQRMDYANFVENFKATDENDEKLKWEKSSVNSWKVIPGDSKKIILNYDLKTTRPFVATSYVEEEKAYIIPAASFFHIAGNINHPATVIVDPGNKWNRVATGLDSVIGKKFTYTAPDFDILYDCPILIGNLEELEPFTVQGISHRFIGHQLGDFDRQQFMADLKKIVEASVKIIGHIPYKQYTFIAIGPGAGGIEHLNNTTFSFSGAGLNNRGGRIRLLHFLAHEYFHHYNVKRIRPIELGPFDYDHGSRTKMLWVSEGLSVYYEYLVVKRAGISTEEELLDALRNNMISFENKPGRLFQSLTQASWETWSDGPFGRSGDDAYKTISYYDKGPVAGLLLDLRIRHETKNKKSLDDVMRVLYREYYLEKKRGFTEVEFNSVCEQIAGSNLEDFFEYISTTKEIDYPTYLDYAGLSIDTTSKLVPGGWLGINTRQRNDTLFVTSVDWQSPAWNAGIRQQDAILKIDDMSLKTTTLNDLLKTKKPGEKIKVVYQQKNDTREQEIILGQKTEKKFLIDKMVSPEKLQKEIFEGWLKG